MTQKLQIRFKDAVEAIKTMDEVENVQDLVKIGFEITDMPTGQANVQAKASTEPNPELVAAAALLFENGRKVAKTKEGREKHILGEQQGVAPWRVVVTIAPEDKS